MSVHVRASSAGLDREARALDLVFPGLSHELACGLHEESDPAACSGMSLGQHAAVGRGGNPAARPRISLEMERSCLASLAETELFKADDLIDRV